MSFTFASARFGQIYSEDGGLFDPFSSTSSGSATTPGGGASSGGGTASGGGEGGFDTGPGAGGATREGFYGDGAGSGSSKSLSKGGKTYTGVMAQSKGAANAQKELAKAEMARAREGIKRFLEDSVRAQFRAQQVVSAKSFFESLPRLDAGKAAAKKNYETAVSNQMRNLANSFTGNFRVLSEDYSGSADTGPAIPPSVSSPAINRFTMFVLAPRLLAKIKADGYASVIEDKRFNQRLNANLENSKTENVDTLTQFANFTPADKGAFFAAAAAGTGFPAAGFDAARVTSMGPAAYARFAAGSDVVDIMIGNRLADAYGVSRAAVQQAKNALLQTTAGGTIYAGGREGGGEGTFYGERAPEQRRGVRTGTVTGAKSAYVKQKQEQAKEKALALENARRERAAKTEQYRKAQAAKAAAVAKNNTAEAARQQKILDDAAAAAAAAEARAAAAEKALQEAQAAVNAATQTAQPIPGVVQAGGGGEISPPTLAPAVVTPTEAPSTTGETAIVTTDSTGTPAVVVPDQAVPEAAQAPLTTPVPAKPGPNVGLLVVAALAVGGGIWWFKNRRA